MSSTDSSLLDALKTPAITVGEVSIGQVDDSVLSATERKPPFKWYVAIAFTLSILMMGMSCIGWSIYKGTGVWGNNDPVFWGWPIVNFVFWVGIGHAGTLISAILFLFRQKWRNAIARFAEAMTIFAVMCAAIFPVIHTGRPWLAAFWLFPYPNTRGMWVNFNSPLIWDVFAVSTYFTVSLLFWYVGLIPDFASVRDRAKGTIRRMIYGVLSLGWRGSATHWNHYEKAYMILAGLATPLVLSVHSIVSFDFAVSLLPGWHTTIFPPYFVAGAIFSGFAMVVTVLVFVRNIMNLEHLITVNHLETMNKVILATGSMVGYAYATEFFMAWYAGHPYEFFVFLNRATGPYAWAYWIMVSCNVIAPQFFWFKALRRSVPFMLVISIFVNIGMWFERFVIVATSLHHDFMPSAWDYFRPTIIDVGIFVGSFGLFFTMVLLFTRGLPVIATAEVKAVLPGTQPHHGHGGDHHV
ncbi:MAG: polysulfide reductase NrfD [Calditrichaeota bacterium]|nr:polysulfide reductase NrfD [Calditrichota bacterium]MCB9473718.1 polysulfide reductase NrfD [Candidatus Delongbacteria bacterium]